MGLFGDIAGKVVLKYEADTAQAKIALRELTGEQKANAKAAIQGMEDQKAAHDRMVKGITVGLGIAAGAIAVGVSAYKAYAEQSRLAAASAAPSCSTRSPSRGPAATRTPRHASARSSASPITRSCSRYRAPSPASRASCAPATRSG